MDKKIKNLNILKYFIFTLFFSLILYNLYILNEEKQKYEIEQKNLILFKSLYNNYENLYLNKYLTLDSLLNDKLKNQDIYYKLVFFEENLKTGNKELNNLINVYINIYKLKYSLSNKEILINEIKINVSSLEKYYIDSFEINENFNLKIKNFINNEIELYNYELSKKIKTIYILFSAIFLSFLILFSIIILINTYYEKNYLIPINRILKYLKRNEELDKNILTNKNYPKLVNDFIYEIQKFYHNQKEKIKLMKSALYDDMTGTLKRNAFFGMIEGNFNEIKDGYIMIMDIDKFKEVNDNYGHDVGDFVIINFVNIIKNLIDDNGYICRWGGEEFVVLLKNPTKEKSLEFAKKINKEVENYEFKYLDSKPFLKKTVSIGLSYINFEKNDDKDDISSVVDRYLKNADKALYFSKNNGRNMVVDYEDIKNKI